MKNLAVFPLGAENPEGDFSDRKNGFNMLDNADLKPAVQPLLGWYEKNKRDLPWRRDASPYRVWVSEIMLQQTRVETVKPYFERFVRELPDVRALAECQEGKLLKLWEGLGYYCRVRNMQKAAAILVRDYGGEFPQDYEKLLELPGIGRYTAGAVASIAFGSPVPAVDGNVLRVLMRFADDSSDIASQVVKRRAEAVIQAAMPEENPGEFNQALMELGALVCLPNGGAVCGACPWKEMCLGRKNGHADVLPVKKKTKSRRSENRTVFLIFDGGAAALHRRPERGLLAGLYEFPNVEGFLSEEEALEEVRGLGLMPLRIQRLPDAVHIFTHVEWHMRGYRIRVGSPAGPDEERRNRNNPGTGVPEKGKSMDADLKGVKRERAEKENPADKDDRTEKGRNEEIKTEGQGPENFEIRNAGETVQKRSDQKKESLKRDDLLFIETEELKEKYAVPAAFAAYMKFL